MNATVGPGERNGDSAAVHTWISISSYVENSVRQNMQHSWGVGCSFNSSSISASSSAVGLSGSFYHLISSFGCFLKCLLGFFPFISSPHMQQYLDYGFLVRASAILIFVDY